MINPQSSRRPKNAHFAKNDPANSYESDLFHWLINAKDYRKFERRIADELSKIKINGWSYIRLDIPIQLSASDFLGTVSPEHVKMYEAENFGSYDMSLQHSLDRLTPVFKSDIDNFVKKSPVATPYFEGYKQLSMLNDSYDCKDCYSVPLVNDNMDGRALFAVNSKGGCEEKFKDIVKQNALLLMTIGRAINDAGVINFPDIFTDGKKGFERLVNSQPFNLLVTMVKWDLSLNQAADRLGISVNTAQKHILNIRRALGVKTNYGAYEAALRQGLIVM